MLVCTLSHYCWLFQSLIRLVIMIILILVILTVSSGVTWTWLLTILSLISIAITSIVLLSIVAIVVCLRVVVLMLLAVWLIVRHWAFVSFFVVVFRLLFLLVLFVVFSKIRRWLIVIGFLECLVLAVSRVSGVLSIRTHCLMLQSVGVWVDSPTSSTSLLEGICCLGHLRLVTIVIMHHPGCVMTDVADITSDALEPRSVNSGSWLQLLIETEHVMASVLHLVEARIVQATRFVHYHRVVWRRHATVAPMVVGWVGVVVLLVPE